MHQNIFSAVLMAFDHNAAAINSFCGIQVLLYILAMLYYGVCFSVSCKMFSMWLPLAQRRRYRVRLIAFVSGQRPRVSRGLL